MEFHLGHDNIPEFKSLTKAQRTEVWAVERLGPAWAMWSLPDC